jgi:hypothetical protein
MRPAQFFDGFELDNDLAVDQKIKPMPADHLPLIFNLHFDFMLNSERALPQLDRWSTVIDRLNETWPEHRVNLYHRFDDAIGERIPVGTALIPPIPSHPLIPFQPRRPQPRAASVLARYGRSRQARAAAARMASASRP